MPTAADIRAALRRRYAQPSWALLFEIGDETGAGKRRAADALAMSLWPSRGLSLEGIEIKVSRSDWIRELKAPAKAESIARHCNAWWVATTPDVIREDLPAGWGHLVLSEKGELVVQTPAPTTTAAGPVDRRFLAAILRGAAKVGAADLDAEFKLLHDRLESEFAARLEMRVNADLGARSRAQNLVQAIAAAIGEDQLPKIDDAEVARAVALVVKSGIAQTWSGISGVREMLIGMAQKIESAEHDLGLPASPGRRTPKHRN